MKTLLAYLFFMPHRALAQITPDDTGLTTTGGAIYGSQPDIAEFLGQYIIAPALGVLGMLFFVLLIYSGVLWMTAGGKETQITKAKSVLTNSLIGLVLVVASYAISQFIINALST